MQKTSYIFSILYLFLLYVPTYIIAEPHKMHGKHRRVRGENKGVVVPSLSYRYNDIDRQESHKMLRNMYEQRMNEEMEKIEKIRAAIDKNKDHIKTLRKHEDKRRAKVTHHEKHQALITARHAETKKESEEKEYACSRIHGTVDHPGIKALQKKDRDLHNDLSAAHKEYKKYKKDEYLIEACKIGNI